MNVTRLMEVMVPIDRSPVPPASTDFADQSLAEGGQNLNHCAVMGGVDVQCARAVKANLSTFIHLRHPWAPELLHAACSIEGY